MFLHRDVKITVSGAGLFQAKVKDVDVVEKTLDAAQAAIDKLLSSYAKARTLNLKVVGILTDTGYYYEHKVQDADKIHHAVLVGMNRTSGDLVFTGVPKDRALRAVMPDTPGCEAKLVEFIAANQVIKHIKKFELKGRSGRVAAENYEEYLDKLELEYAAAKHEHES